MVKVRKPSTALLAEAPIFLGWEAIRTSPWQAAEEATGPRMSLVVHAGVVLAFS